MTELNRTHLDQLENQSIFIFREAYHAFKNIAMPWSMGKDSNVLIWLARKSFFGKVPFPVLHIDTTYEFPGTRDPKNLYKKARAGEIRDFTGIDAPYEAPEDPEIVVRTDQQTVDESVTTVLEQLLPRLREYEANE